MKIMAVCGCGLGSSFMLELNIKKVLRSLGFEEVQVEHSDLSSLAKNCADLFVATRDIAPQCVPYGKVVSLKSALDKRELKDKLKTAIEEINLVVSELREK